MSVINLFELGKRYQAGEPDFYISEFINNAANKMSSNENDVKRKDILASSNPMINVENMEKNRSS